MAIYRLQLNRETLLKLVVSSALFCTLIFVSGGLVGVWMAPALLNSAPGGVPEGVSLQALSRDLALDLEALCPAGEGPGSAAAVTSAMTLDRPDAFDTPLAFEIPQAIEAFESPRELDSRPATENVPLPSPVQLAPPSAPTPRYAVQIGAFGVRENAESLAQDLRRRGYDPLIVAVRSRSGDWLNHVHLSLHEDEASARAMARRFSEQETLSALVVPAPSSFDRN